MDLLLLIDENKSHYVYIKDFDRFIFYKTKNKSEKHFCKICLQCFSCKYVLTEIKNKNIKKEQLSLKIISNKH